VCAVGQKIVSTEKVKERASEDDSGPEPDGALAPETEHGIGSMHVLEHEIVHLLRCSLQKRASTLRGQPEPNHDLAKAFDAANS
jgi:hypothetical protein